MPSIDDKEDMQFADEAYDILGFSNEEKYNVYKVNNKCESAVLLFPFLFTHNIILLHKGRQQMGPSILPTTWYSPNHKIRKELTGLLKVSKEGLG